MSGRYAKLTRDWMLRGWSDMPRALVNWATGEQRVLKTMGLYVAESCDGQTDFESLAFLPNHQAMLDLLVAEGIAEECQEGDSVERWQRYRKAKNPRLTGIHWHVTGRCNLNCRHCYMQAPAGRYGQLPFDAMARLVEQFERANVLEVSLTGGEPFLRRDLLNILQLLAQRKIRLAQIFSNGLLITDRHLAGIRKVGFSPAFQISFDGVGAHDQMRGTRGTEERVVGAIRRLRAAGFPVVVATAIDQLNLAALADTYGLVRGLGVQGWRISAPQETGNWRGTTTAAALDQQADACAPLLRRWLKDGRPFSIQLSGFYNGGRPRSPESGRPVKRKPRAGRGLRRPAEVPDTPVHTPESYDCGACREQPNLLPDGTLVPCPGYVDNVFQDRMPNLLREDLSKVWRRSFLRRFVDMKKKDVLAKNPECAACELFKDCGAGCRASALTETGNLLAKDPVACELHKKGYKKRFREMADEALGRPGPRFRGPT
ncbi:MAG: radical SAM protein [Planctomycetes bacterium]|nr:radical SAM protein [Planctomycetota bacterium]